MILNKKALQKLRDLITHETEYRSGADLVSFFNELGFKDKYGQGFPSRWAYAQEKLDQINGTPEIDKCIRSVFAPVNFIGKISELDAHIANFNQYLAFDKWQVVRKNDEIAFQKVDNVKIDDSPKVINEDEFLNKEFKDISLESIGLDEMITDVLKVRFEEIKSCFTAKAPLSVIFLSGSTLEGILLGIALKNPKEFNQSNSAAINKEGKVKQFHEWTLSQFIDTAQEIGFLNEDVRKFSHALRDFRNYIHPYEQLSSRFNPDMHTANICWQVLKAAINQLAKNRR